MLSFARLALASSLASIALGAAACSVSAEPVVLPPAPAVPADGGEAPTAPSDDDEPAEGEVEGDAGTRPAEAGAPAAIARVVLTGKLSKVDLTYQRAGKFIVLDLQGAGALATSSVASVSARSVSLAKTTAYELLYPTLGACDAPPELTLRNGQLTLALQRAGEPNGTISGCFFLASGVKATDGGFQARFKNVPLSGGGTVAELLLDVAGTGP